MRVAVINPTIVRYFIVRYFMTALKNMVMVVTYIGQTRPYISSPDISSQRISFDSVIFALSHGHNIYRIFQKVSGKYRIETTSCRRCRTKHATIAVCYWTTNISLSVQRRDWPLLTVLHKLFYAHVVDKFVPAVFARSL